MDIKSPVSEVDLDKQKTFFYAGPHKIDWVRVAAAVRSTPTPMEKFKITEKVAKKRSNRYGKIYDGEGNLVISHAAIKIDIIPKGGHFEGAPMPYFMRLTNEMEFRSLGRPASFLRLYPSTH